MQKLWCCFSNVFNNRGCVAMALLSPNHTDFTIHTDVSKRCTFQLIALLPNAFQYISAVHLNYFETSITWIYGFSTYLPHILMHQFVALVKTLYCPHWHGSVSAVRSCEFGFSKYVYFYSTFQQQTSHGASKSKIQHKHHTYIYKYKNLTDNKRNNTGKQKWHKGKSKHVALVPLVKGVHTVTESLIPKGLR